MIEYKISVKQVGNVINTVKVFAKDALTAIESVEKTYKSRSVSLTGKGNQVSYHQWTGLEFEARRV